MVPFPMTLSDLELFSEILNDTKRRAVSLLLVSSITVQTTKSGMIGTLAEQKFVHERGKGDLLENKLHSLY